MQELASEVVWGVCVSKTQSTVVIRSAEVIKVIVDKTRPLQHCNLFD